MLEAIEKNRADYVAPNKNLERAAKPYCKAERLLYIDFNRKDLKQTAEFMTNFGLQTSSLTGPVLYMHGTGPDPVCFTARAASRDSFAGLGFTVASEAGLKELAAASGAVIKPHALGGKYLELTDPAGNRVDVCFGLPGRKDGGGKSSPTNTADTTERVGETVRLATDPAHIKRLGHTVLSGPKIKELITWYTKYLGLIVSDFQFVPGHETPVMAFMRLDKGDVPTDHHTIGIGSALHIGHVHSAFEVADFNDLTQGSNYLSKRAAHHSWGIGRHYLGSQIFDYWRDPAGELFELYTDGDVLTSDVATGYYKFSKASLAQWGPGATNDFMEKTFNFKTARTIAGRLFSDDDMTLGRLLALAKHS